MENLSIKQSAFCLAYVEMMTLKDACASVGITSQTGDKYLKLPEVRNKIREIRTTIFDQSVSRLITASNKAVSTLLEVLDNPKSPAYTKVKASEVLLCQAVEYYKTYILESQIADLELAIEDRGVVDVRRIG